MTLSKDFLIRLLILCLPTLEMACLWFYGNEKTAQLTILGTLAVLISLLIITFRQVMNSKLVMLLALGCLSIIGTLAYHKGLGSGIMLINLLLAACIFNNLIVSQNTYRWIHLVTGAILLFYLFTVNYHSIGGGWVFSRFGASPINRNEIGVLWFGCIAHLLCYFHTFSWNKFLEHLVNIALLLTGGYFIMWANCRSALFALILFVLLVFFKKEPFSISAYGKIARSTLIASLGFVFLYLFLIPHLEATQILGKGFATRQTVWARCVDLIQKYPWLGSGNDFPFDILGTAGASSHNMLLGMWKMFGIIPTLLVIFLLVNNHTYKLGIKIEKIAQFAFLSSLLIAFFEAFLTASQTYLFFLLFLICQVKPYEIKSAK